MIQTRNATNGADSQWMNLKITIFMNGRYQSVQYILNSSVENGIIHLTSVSQQKFLNCLQFSVFQVRKAVMLMLHLTVDKSKVRFGVKKRRSVVNKQ